MRAVSTVVAGGRGFIFWMLLVKGEATVCDKKDGLTANNHKYLARGLVGVNTRARSERKFEPRLRQCKACGGGVRGEATEGVCGARCVVHSARRIALFTAHAVSLSGGGPWSFMAKNMAVTGKRCPPPRHV